jgi:hypothetical protein
MEKDQMSAIDDFVGVLTGETAIVVHPGEPIPIRPRYRSLEERVQALEQELAKLREKDR